MRRTTLAGNRASNDGSTAASSSVPSKATSEAGAENTSDEGLPSPPEAAFAKDRSKWTREEKEAHYKAARERIFRDFQEAHASENSPADTSANMSRSSSSSGKKKGHKQKAARDDSFEARSSYIPGYPGMPYSSHSQQSLSFGVGGYQSPYGTQTPNPMPTMPYGPGPAPQYNQYDPSSTFQGMNYPANYPNQYTTSDSWPNPQSPQPGGYFNCRPQPGPVYPQYGSAMSSPVSQYPPMGSPTFQAPNQAWVQAQYQPFPQQPIMQAPIGQNGTPMPWQSYTIPNTSGAYPFGQNQYHQYSSTPPPTNQHPLPGSYNRSLFNPQTRSFIPGGANMRFGGQSRSPGSPYASQTSVSTQNPEKPAPNKALESLQKKWGTPAHLPKKPPPSQVPSSFEIENTPPLPSQQSFPPLASSIAKGSPSLGNN
jgi:SUZ domain